MQMYKSCLSSHGQLTEMYQRNMKCRYTDEDEIHMVPSDEMIMKHASMKPKSTNRLTKQDMQMYK